MIKTLKFIMKRIGVVLLTLFILLNILSTGMGALAAQVASDLLISTYTCDFDGNYYTDLKSETCTLGTLAEVDGRKVLSFEIETNSQTEYFEIHNTDKSKLQLQDKKVYAVSVTYKVEQIGGNRFSQEGTYINLARFTGKKGELARVKGFNGTPYYYGDTTGWVTQTVVFKAGVASSPEYSRLAVNVVSNSCDSTYDGISDKTIIHFDKVVVTECNENAKAIEFEVNGGSDCEPILAQAGAKIELPTPVRDLYDFDGWYTDINFTKKFSSNKMPSNLTTRVYAKWKVKDEAIVVSYVTNCDEQKNDSVGRVKDKLELPSLKKPGFHFLGWYDKELKTRVELDSFPTDDITLYAKWEYIPRRCNFENANVYPSANNTSFSKRCEISQNVVYSGDYSLHYNYALGPTTKTGLARVILRDEYDNPIAIEEGKKYTISFKYNVVAATENCRFGMTLSLVNNSWSSHNSPGVLYNDNYCFTNDVGKGWLSYSRTYVADPIAANANYVSIGIGGDAEIYIDDIIIYENVEGSDYDGKKSALYFDTQGGNIIENVYAEHGSEITLPTPVREGYIFLDWAYDEVGMQSIDGETIKLDKIGTVLYASWHEIPSEPSKPNNPEDVQSQDTSTPKKEPIEQDSGDLIIYIIVGAVVLIAATVTIILVVLKKKSKNKIEITNEKSDDQSK